MFCSTAEAEESLDPSGHLQTIKERHNVCKGVDLQKNGKSLASLKEAMSIHDQQQERQTQMPGKTSHK